MRRLAIVPIVLISCALFMTSEAQTITFSFKDVTLDSVFSAIQRQTPFRFIYTNEELKEAGTITLSVERATVRDVLELALKNRPLSYTIEKTFITVRRKQNEDLKEQRKILNGVVLNEKGEPLAGTTINIKGTIYSTISDDKGNFSLANVNEKDILVISHVGYESKIIYVGDRREIEVRLSLTVSKLDEVQVIGYGETTERYATGSMSKITSKEIADQPVTNLLSAVSGRAPGVFVQSVNGLPGGNIRIQVRGVQSIAAGTDPLYVIDGIPFSSSSLTIGNSDLSFVNGAVNPLGILNPMDIESIEVLKDADATAIYGSRGANGVVLITTKKGSYGKTRLNVNFYQGYHSVSRYARYLGLKDYLMLRHEGFSNDGITPSSDPNDEYYAPDLTVWDTTRSTDWQKWFLGNSDPVTDAQASLSGGTANTHFLFGLNYHAEGSILPGDQDYKRGGGHLNVETGNAGGRFHAQLHVSYSTDDNKLLKDPSAVNIASLPPDFPAYNSDGSLNWELGLNPYAFLRQKALTKSSNLVSNALLKYRLLDGLDLKLNAGYTRTEMDMLSTLPASSQDPALGEPVNDAFYGQNRISTWLAEPQLAWMRHFWGGTLQALLGATFQQTTTGGYNLEGSDFANESQLENLGSAGDIINYGNHSTDYKYVSLFARLNYGLQEKYLLNLNFRRDGSTRFGPGKQYGNFGSAGAGWIFSKEKLFRHRIPFLSYGKLRASYGLVGNDQIPDYQYLSTYGNGYVYQGIATLTPQVIANARYSWETTHKTDIALELGFFRDRFLVTASYFYDRSSNELVAYPLPYISGPFGSYEANFPAVVENKGLELELHAALIQGNSFNWSVDMNLTLPKNKLVSYPDIANSPYANTYTVGQDLSSLKGYRFTGVDPATGVSQFLDVNKDGLVSYPADYLAMGKTSPRYFGGVGNNFKYKGLSLDVFFQFVGQDAATNLYNYIPGPAIQNYIDIALRRWQKTGDMTDVQKASADYGSEASSARLSLSSSGRQIVNGSYMRLKNISLTYQLPASWLKRWKFEQFSLFVIAENLWTLTADRDADPEVSNGLNYAVPVLKTLAAGIRFTL
ncbi:MAG: SusC/RagA family TonB-linked outer membrane protein [Bacteroidetes bacterium]|nr:SusC/RagA family TonB-linked outer membrane protein [Bacteroidota bacterium]